MENWLNRTELLIGSENLNKLRKSHVAVFGCGGVGSYVVEALARAGISKITVVDKDAIDITNINRQLIATTKTVDKPKVDVVKQRLLEINPDIKVITYQTFYDESKAEELLSKDYTYIVDAIDTVSSKISLIEEAKKRNIPIISCMGTGNKLDPTAFEVTDISKTSVCPLAKVIRKELNRRSISNVKVVYSKEVPHRFNNNNSRTPASISFVPSVAGLILASEVIKDIIKL